MKRLSLLAMSLPLFVLCSCGENGISSQSQIASSGEEASSGVSTDAYQYGEKEMYEKFWDTEIVHNETLCLFEHDDGSIYGELFYQPKKVISVRDYSLDTVYEEGKDYIVEGNKIILAIGSKIPYFTAKNMSGEEVPEDYGISTYNANEDGSKKIMFTEGVGIIMHQLSVTYSHEDSWPSSFVPAYQGDSLPKTQAKLANKKSLSICLFGDSIMTGANSTGKLGVAPYQDTYPDAFEKLLKEKYPNSDITLTNNSVGGWLSRDGWSNIDNGVNALHPDLVFLGFGMNDGSWKIPADDYVDNIDMMIRSIKANTPDAEIVVFATILPNPNSIQNQLQESYLAPLKEDVAQYSGAIVLDMTSFSKIILSRKQSVDVFANNINHPADFMVRQYVSNIMTLLVKGF